MIESQIVNIITDNRGSILNIENAEFYKKFEKFDLEVVPVFSEKLIITEKINYIFFKIPIEVENLKYKMLIFKEWRLISQEYIYHENFKITEPLKNIENFSNHEQEVIFALLFGYVQDKDILYFLKKYKSSNFPCVKYTMKILFEKINIFQKR